LEIYNEKVKAGIPALVTFVLLFPSDSPFFRHGVGHQDLSIESGDDLTIREDSSQGHIHRFGHAMQSMD